MSAGSAEFRIGDAEREQAQTTLGEHYTAGRLDHDEYSERLDRIWAARTQAELHPVFADLPGALTAPSYAYSTPATRRPSPPSRTRPSRPPLPLLVVLVVLGAIAVLTHLPIILVGAGVWFFFLRGGSGCGSSRRLHSSQRW